MHRFASCFALLGLTFGVAGFAPAALAQDNGAAGADSASMPQHRAPDPQKQAARLAKRLGLSNDQTAKLTTILQNRQQQVAAARSDNSLAPRDRRAKMHSIQQDADTQINAVLSPDQQKQYATLKQSMRDRRENQRGTADAGGEAGNSSDSGAH